VETDTSTGALGCGGKGRERGRNMHGWVGFLPRQKVFLPGQWKKLVKTTEKRQKLAISLVH